MSADLHLLKQEYINRVTVDHKDSITDISIKAKHFGFTNRLLSFMMFAFITVEITVGYFMFTKPAYLEYLFPILVCVTGIILVIFTRMWLWHLFGEEQITMKGSIFSSKRNYGLFSTKDKILNFNDTTSLYVNKTDGWNWKELRKKGVLRLTNNEMSIDFGKDLDYQEYELITRLLSSKINEYSHINSSTIINTNKEKTIETGKVDTTQYKDQPSHIKIVKSPFHKSA